MFAKNPPPPKKILVLDPNPGRFELSMSQRRRDNDKHKTCALRGGALEAERENRPKKLVFRGKRHEIRILKVQCDCLETVVLENGVFVVAENRWF